MNNTILDAIGNTPLVEIRTLNPNPKVKILAKLEYLNPGGSIKDRPALCMIEDGEKSGLLTKDKTVVEATSGNTGIGLALVCGVKGYKLLLTMSDAVSEERRKILKARGAEILLTPGRLGTDGAIEEVYRLSRENPEKYFLADQFNNEANWKAHYNGTAEEIWAQTSQGITHLVATMGTTGTLMGLSRKFRELNPEIKIVGVEPYLGHKIQGLKNMKEAYCPEIFEKKRLDEKVNIHDEDAFETARRLAREEGLFVGMSSGAAMFVAQEKARELDEGVIVVILPDSGERYLSTTLFSVPETVSLKVFNTAAREKQPLVPMTPGSVSIYSCGPTVDGRLDLSGCRRMVFSDLLVRYLEFRGLAVNHVMNITDYDDRTIAGAEKAGMELKDFTDGNIRDFMDDLETLGVKPASKYPRASEHFDDMIDLSKKLVARGLAYEELRSLYFDVSKFEDYGSLSGVDLDKIRVGASVDMDEYEKDDPKDFTLMRRTRLTELKRGHYAKTPWGNARPSWHIQCAAMSLKYLGESWDIHTGSRDLTFPHHENELAILKGITGKDSAKYWMHCDNVTLDGKKIDQEGLTIEDALNKGFDGKTIRFWLLSTHYSRSVEFSGERFESVISGLKRIQDGVNNLMDAAPLSDATPYAGINQLVNGLKQGFMDAMDDDLNISAALAVIYYTIKTSNKLIKEGQLDPESAQKLVETLKNIDTVLNVLSFEAAASDPEIEKLIAEREKARADKDFALADQIRDRLAELGVTQKDGKI